MKYFFTFLEKMGGLHDARIQQITWNPIEQTLQFQFEDMYSNFEGLPEYPGRQAGIIALYGVLDIRVDIDTAESLDRFSRGRLTMNVPLDDYLLLLNRFITGTLSAIEFEKRF